MHEIIFFSESKKVFPVFNGGPGNLASNVRIFTKFSTGILIVLFFIKLAAVAKKRLGRYEMIL